MLTHIDANGNPTMVDVGSKAITERLAIAEARLRFPAEVASTLLKAEELHTKKGPVFQTAIIAGIMGSKKTSELIPMCHPLSIDSCKLNLFWENNEVVVHCTVKTTGKTGVEMEALTGATVAALTVYDMCKALSPAIVIKEIKLLQKEGGKRSYLAS